MFHVSIILYSYLYRVTHTKHQPELKKLNPGKAIELI